MTKDREAQTPKKIRLSYDRMVAAGSIETDPAQINLIDRLDQLLIELGRKRLSSKSSSLGWLFSKKAPAVGPVKGLYIWGGVGRGKSMLMDLFFSHLPHKRKRRCHFNDFMSDAQDRIHRQRKAFSESGTGEADPIEVVGKELAEEAAILCFDEFTVTNIADAMILGRLFAKMFEDGVIIVATSNVAPDDLYRDGLNRHLFLPFVDLLKQNVETFLLEARTDFRLEKLVKAEVYYHPLDERAPAELQTIWKNLTGVESGKPLTLELKGRTLEIPEFHAGVARTNFASLCEEARSAEDYLALARQVHTLFLTDIPIIAAENRNVAKRFILLIDTLYDNQVRLLASAAAPPEELYPATKGTESFEFKRTISRLHEMQGEEYMGAYA